MSGSDKRAIVFAHYDKEDIVDPYVFCYLRELKKICRTLIVVSTANLCKQDLDELKIIGCDVIVRDNIGYDFVSYKSGLEYLNHNKFEEIVICNDSVYGPFFDIDKVFKKMDLQRCDFWGITSNDDISFHLQSYFLVFKKSVLNSSAFSDFWVTVDSLDSKNEIIRCYEVGLTQCLLKAGLMASVSADYKLGLSAQIIYLTKRISVRKIKQKIFAIFKGENLIPKINSTHEYWKELLLQGGMPFIKVELLRDNPMEVDIDDYETVIRSMSNYDLTLIKNHLSRMGVNKLRSGSNFEKIGRIERT